MKIAKVINNQIVAYPYALRPNAKRAHPEVSPLPFDWAECKSLGLLSALDAVEVEDSVIPSFDPSTHYVEEVTPVLENGVWRQSFSVLPIQIQVPTEAPMHKFRIALRELGWYNAVNTYMNSLPATGRARESWDRSPTVRRSARWIENLRIDRNLTVDQLDNLFILADSIET